MPSNYNTISLGSGSRTTPGILVPSGVGGSGSVDTSQTDWIAFNLTISGSATVQVETTFDNGTTWFPVYVIKGSDSTTQTNVQASGLWFGNSIGFQTRLNVIAVSGTVTLNGGTTDVTNAPNGTPAQVTTSSSSLVNTQPNAGAASALLVQSAATTNGALIASGGKALFELSIKNTSASAVFVKLYNKATAPAVGTDVPIITIAVSAGTTTATEFGAFGKRFTAGIGIAITGAQADTDTTAVTTGVTVSGTYF